MFGRRRSRAQAIEDGVLVDLTEWARETGFKIPVACTAEVWRRYITPSKGTRELGQSERGRAHDQLFMLFVAINRESAQRQGKANGEPRSNDRLRFDVIFLQAPNKPETIELTAICGPGDTVEPVLTILLPGED